MAFSSSSYFAGIGTVVAAISIGFAGGAMITTSAVQPPNRLERVTASATPPSSASSSPVSQQANVATPATQQPPAQIQAAAVSTPVAAKADIKADTKTDTATNAQQPPPSPPQAAKNEARNEDAAPARNERANVRPADSNREATRSAEVNREPSRKRGDDRKFAERKRRQDLERQNLDDATNVVRQMPRNSTVEVIDEDDAPRVIDGPPRRFGLFGNNEDSPRGPPPPRFGLFGN
jgi:hypothetical protein